jgi:FlaA1/EpsC-like NDP-sugar epimerase
MRLAQLHGLRVPEVIEIVFTGMRPGERMHEALVGQTESPAATVHPKVREIARAGVYDRGDIASLVALLQSLADEGEHEVVRRHLIESACSHPRSVQPAVTTDR